LKEKNWNIFSLTFHTFHQRAYMLQHQQSQRAVLLSQRFAFCTTTGDSRRRRNASLFISREKTKRNSSSSSSSSEIRKMKASASSNVGDDVVPEARKPGVASDEEMKAFLEKNKGKKVTVVDSRNPDFTVEPFDETYGKADGPFPIADCGTEKRPNAVNLPFDREKKALSGFEDSMFSEKDAPIITHCGGGGRGQKSKEWLEAKGFTNVINGGGPQVTALWDMFGSL
jgi:rhodanese-related sulfurtransferase